MNPGLMTPIAPATRWAANEVLSRNQYAEKNDDGTEQWGLTAMHTVPAGDSKFRRGGEALVEMLTIEVLAGPFADLDVEYSLPAKASGLFVLEQQELKNAAEESDPIVLGSLAYGVVSDVLSASVKHEIMPNLPCPLIVAPDAREDQRIRIRNATLAMENQWSRGIGLGSWEKGSFIQYDDSALGRGELLPESWTETSVLTFGGEVICGEQLVIPGAMGGRGSVFRDRLGRQVRGNKTGVRAEVVSGLYDGWRVRRGTTRAVPEGATLKGPLSALGESHEQINFVRCRGSRGISVRFVAFGMRSAGSAAGIGHCGRTRRLSHDNRITGPRALVGWVTERCWRPHGVGGLD